MRQISEYKLPSKISSPPTLGELDEIYEAVRASVIASENWYNEHLRYTRLGSFSVRALGVCALSLGIILPNISAQQDSNAAMLLRLGYVALLSGGLAILLDQVFLFSRSWSRYASASIEIKGVIAQLEFDWLKFKCEHGTSLKPQDGSAALDIFATATSYARKIQLDETKLWKSDLEEAIKAIQDRLQTADKRSSSKF